MKFGKIALAAAALFISAHAHAIDLGVNANYGLVFQTFEGKLKINSGPIVGDVLVGNYANVDSSGGNNGSVTGTFFSDGTITGDLLSLNTPAPATLVSTSLTQQSTAAARAAQDYANGLKPTRVFDSVINGTRTITGNGGLNVISAPGLKNASLTLSGSPTDEFIFNLTGAVDTNKPMTLLGGVLPQNIFWNLNGTDTVFKTAGGNKLYGTFLTTAGDFQFSGLDLEGRLINTGGDVQFVSGSQLVTAPIPEPSQYAMLAAGLMGVFVAKRKALAKR